MTSTDAGVLAPSPPVRAVQGGRTGTQRRLAAYLLLPRPSDLLKALVLPSTFGLALVATGSYDGRQLVRAAVVWLAMELLVYQARYQWNDIRGFAADQAHPDGAARGRLPGPLEELGARHKSLSAAVLVGRLLVVAVLAVALPSLHLGTVLLTVVVAVFGVAVAYETLRSLGTGRTGDVPPPLHPALVGIWVTIGAGYAVRATAGLALGLDLRARPGLAAAAIVTAWATGTVFVTCRWALEGTVFAAVDDGLVSWRCAPQQAREHLLGLVRWLPPTADRRDLPAGAPPRRWRALRGRTPPTSPWNLALLVAGAGAVLTGRLLVAHSGGTGVVGWAAAGLAGAVALVLAGRGRLAVAVLVALLVGVAAGLAALPRPWAVGLPWLAVALLQAHSTTQCAAEIGHRLRRPAR